jgi:hypothetical protein
MRHLFLFFCLILCSCEYSAPDGSCEPVKLSKEKLLFNAEGGIDTVTVNKRFWLSGFIGIGDTVVNYYPSPTYFLISQAEIINFPPSYDYEGDISYLSEEEAWYVEGIKGSWFTIYRVDNKKVIFFVDKNETGKKRSLGLPLDAGDCGTQIDVYQSAE